MGKHEEIIPIFISFSEPLSQINKTDEKFTFWSDQSRKILLNKYEINLGFWQ